MTTSRSVMVMLLLGVLVLAACSTGGKTQAAEPRSYGAAVTATPMPVHTLLEQAASLEDQQVTVSGRLGQVCQDMGCWFYLEDAENAAEGKLYIDLQMGAIFTIPKDSAGKTGVITGTLKRDNSSWKVMGKGVVLS